MAEMNYNRLGNSGLKVSELSFGSWVTFSSQLDTGLARDCMEAAWDAGVNFFDNAEAYAGGKSEEIMGRVFKETGWAREQVVVSTKLYWGIQQGPNTKNTLNRKYLLEGIDGSLRRLDLDYVDLVFCHRSDPDTPMEEVCWAMHDMIERGKALYWGTSEWSGAELMEALDVCDRLGLRKPVMEQPQYHILERHKVEEDYLPVYERNGLGLTTWSPLASGLLTGKYNDGIPEDSRAAVKGYEWLADQLTNPDTLAKVRNLAPIAEELGCSMAQMAIAWCAANPHVSTVITGASRVEQVVQNMGALDVIPKMTNEVMTRIDAAVA